MYLLTIPKKFKDLKRHDIVKSYNIIFCCRAVIPPGRPGEKPINESIYLYRIQLDDTVLLPTVCSMLDLRKAQQHIPRLRSLEVDCEFDVFATDVEAVSGVSPYTALSYPFELGVAGVNWSKTYRWRPTCVRRDGDKLLYFKRDKYVIPPKDDFAHYEGVIRSIPQTSKMSMGLVHSFKMCMRELMCGQPLLLIMVRLIASS